MHYGYVDGVATTDALAVLSVSFIESETSHSLFMDYMVNLGNGDLNLGSSITYPDFNVFFEPLAEGKFWSYSGSLTTPGCDEIVTWIVLEEPLTASPAQIAAFAQMAEGDMYLDGNARETQDGGDRTIYMKSKPSGALAQAAVSVVSMVAIAAASLF